MYYPRKTISRREKAFDMYRVGATATQVALDLGLSPKTAKFYRGLYNRHARHNTGLQPIFISLTIPANCHPSRFKEFEAWVQGSCVPVFFAAEVKSAT